MQFWTVNHPDMPAADCSANSHSGVIPACTVLNVIISAIQEYIQNFLFVNCMIVDVRHL